MGRIILPEKVDMQADSQLWRQHEEKSKGAQQLISFQGNYIKDLIAATDYPLIDIEAINWTFMEWEKDKASSIMQFRDNSYRSVMTGKMAAKHHTLWLDAMDDSKESFLS
jgi:trimethylamine monooxygenase